MNTTVQADTETHESKEPTVFRDLPTVVLESTSGWSSLGLRDLWQYRELLYFLIWREIQGAYRQTALGITWLFLRPVLYMLLLSLVFGRLLGVSTGDVPYPLFVLTALLPWGFFSNGVIRGSRSLVQNMHMISKVYFPRLVIPIAGASSGLVDLGAAFTVFIIAMLIYRVSLRWEIVFLPVFIVVALGFSLAIGLWLATLSVKYRDVEYAVNFLLLSLMYLSPVMYPVEMVPESFRFIYELNPMTGVILGFRWTLLGAGEAPSISFYISVAIVFFRVGHGGIRFSQDGKDRCRHIMNQLAIRADRLSKRYLIGKTKEQGNGQRSIFRALSTPFQYLATTIRPPSEEEILWALKDVSFEVSHGEAVGIIGRNGAGKSTLLKILSRITEPTTGRAVLHGRVGSLLEIGTGFHPELTGRENIYLSGAIFGMKRAEINRKFDEIVAFAEVERFLDTQVKRYSSGMYVRLAFAVAAHLETEILIIDEVLAVGDARFQKKCLGKMGDVAQHGRTVLFVSHNMVAVQNLCPRAILLHHGHIVKEGETRDVVSSYLSTAVEDTTNRTWSDPETAPGNEKVRIHSINVSTRGGNRDAQITMETPLELIVELWNLVPRAQMLIGYRFITEQNEVAFTTVSNEYQEGFSGETMERGLFRSVCEIPANFLNEGGYRIILFVYQDRGKVIFRLDDALSFNVVNVGKRPGYRYSREPGAVRPLFDWTTDFLREI